MTLPPEMASVCAPDRERPFQPRLSAAFPSATGAASLGHPSCSDRAKEPSMSSRGQIDRVAIAYVLCGIPAIAGFAIVLFTLVHLFNIPA